jgi:hypothetical protein
VLNPGGRPRWQPYTDAYRKYAGLRITELKVTARDTAVEATIKSILRMAIQGNVRAAIEAADRTEGRVPLPVTTPEGGEFVLNLISHIPRPDRREKSEMGQDSGLGYSEVITGRVGSGYCLGAPHSKS